MEEIDTTANGYTTRIATLWVRDNGSMVKLLKMNMEDVQIQEGGTVTELFLNLTDMPTSAKKGTVSNKGNIGTVTVSGYGTVNNEASGKLDTVNLAGGNVDNQGVVDTLNKAPGSTGAFTGNTAGNTQENMVKILLGPIANGTITIQKADGSPVQHNDSVQSGTELTVAAAPDTGYSLKNGSLMQNGTKITGGKFTVGDQNVTITAEFISKDTVQIWDGSNNPLPGIYEVTTPLEITGTVIIPSGVEIRLGTGESLTVKSGGVLQNSGNLKIPFTVEAGGSVNNGATGQISSITVRTGGVVDNYGIILSGTVSGGEIDNHARVDSVQVSSGYFYVLGSSAIAKTVTQSGGTVDCFSSGSIQSLSMTGGTAWSSDGGVIQNAAVDGGTLKCIVHNQTNKPGTLGDVTIRTGSLINEEGCTIQSLTIPAGATPHIENEGTIQTVNGELITGYEIPDPVLLMRGAFF